MLGWLWLFPLCVWPASGTSRLLYVPHVKVASLDAVAAADGVVHVRWQTTLELGVQSFRVLGGPSAATTLQPLGADSIPATGDEAGAAYDLPDHQAAAGAAWHYELHLSANAADAPIATWDGVIRGTPRTFVAAMAPAPAAGGVTPLGPSTPPAPQCWIGSGPRIQPWTNSLPADRVRLSLRYEGLYRVNAQELATALGVAASVITTAMTQTNLCLTCQGASVSWYADGTGTNLYFYALAPTTHDAPENVYWVSLAPGAAMAVSDLPPATPGITNACFMYRIEQQGTDYLNRVTRTALVGPTVPDTMFSGVLTPSSAAIQKTTPLTAAATGTWSGTVVVRLLSTGDAGYDHHQASVTLGGCVVGTPSWDGEQYLEFAYPFSSTNLAASGQATLAVKNSGVSYHDPGNSGNDSSRFLWASYAYVYPRLYQATNGALRCTGGTGNTVCVTGFATNDLLALDVTTTNQAVLMGSALVALSATNSSAGWQLAFPAGGTDRTYAVFSRSTGCLQPSVRGARDVTWADPANAADEVILVPPEGWCPGFRQALQPLADFRNAQGLKTEIVDAESVYNTYSFGLVDTAAIRAFVSDGYTAWGTHTLKYLLLAGSGAMDYKHLTLSVNSASACLLPTIQGRQSERYLGTTPVFDGFILACDQALGVVTAGGVAPDVAIGRIPATTTQDVTTVVQKTIAYEGALLWKQQAVVGADWDRDPASAFYFHFKETTDHLLPWLTAAGRTITKLYPSLDPDDPGNLVPNRDQQLFPALLAGSGLFHFFGHADEQDFGGGGIDSYSGLYPYPLLSNSDISSDNWQKPPILISLACRVNRWQSMSATVIIEPLGLVSPGTGFAAAIGPTGFLMAEDEESLETALYSTAAQEKTLRLGDVLRHGLQQVAATIPVADLQSVSLIGDPALVYRPDITALGTPVSWLSQYGFTAPNADATNRAANGWAVWQDYQAGLNPIVTNQLRMTRVAVEPQTGPTSRLTVAFATTSNGEFRLMRQDSLLATDDWHAVSWAWTNGLDWAAPDAPIPAVAPITTVTTPISCAPGGTQGFFRVQTAP